MSSLDHSPRGQSEVFEAQKCMRDDFLTVFNESPTNVAQQIKSFSGAENQDSLKHFPDACIVIDDGQKNPADNSNETIYTVTTADDTHAAAGDTNATATVGDTSATATNGDNSLSANQNITINIELPESNERPEHGRHHGEHHRHGHEPGSADETPEGEHQSHERETGENRRRSRDTECDDETSETGNGDSSDADCDTATGGETTPYHCTINIINITPAQLPYAFSGACGGDSSSYVPQQQSLLRGLQNIFRPTDAFFPVPRIPSPTDFMQNLGDLMNGSNNSFLPPSPMDFISNLQRSFTNSDSSSYLPMPPSPDRFLRDLTNLLGYTSDNQRLFPTMPSPEQFTRGLGRSLGFDSAPIGNTNIFRTLGPRHSMNPGQDFSIRIPELPGLPGFPGLPGESGGSSFLPSPPNPGDLLSDLPFSPPNPGDLLGNLPFSPPNPGDLLGDLPFSPPNPGDLLKDLPSPLDPLAPIKVHEKVQDKIEDSLKAPLKLGKKLLGSLF